MGQLVTVCVVGTCAALAGLAALQIQVKAEAGRGGDARTRQQQTFPVSMKLYTAAYRRGEITRRDLECFRTGVGCSPAPHGTP